MTITVGNDTLTYEVRPAAESTPRFELTVLYTASDGSDSLDRIELSVDSRRAITKTVVSESLTDWTEEHPDARIEEFAVLVIDRCRWGRVRDTDGTNGTGFDPQPRHPHRLRAVDDAWEQLRYGIGDQVTYSIGGRDSGVYGVESGQVVGTSGQGETYWVEVDGDRKRVPEHWIVTVDRE